MSRRLEVGSRQIETALRLVLRLSAALLACLPYMVRAQEPQNSSPGRLTIDRIFHSGELSTRHAEPVVWSPDGATYTVFEPSGSLRGGRDLVRYNPDTGARAVIVPAERFVPPRASGPLPIDSYSFSADGRRLLLFTNTVRVWRTHSRGDYWVLEIGSGQMTKLGGEAAASTLQFAKFSPDGRSVGYVRENDIYVEELAAGRIRRITTDGSATTINGTFDWVYEEEFGLRDGWRWSPDGRSIAYWQFDTTGVKIYTLINNTDTQYPVTKLFAYPKPGETNSAARIGVVPVTGGRTRWVEIPGDPRNNYLARMDWSGDPREINILQLNRLQNRAEVWLADTRTGRARSFLVETDDAWLDYWVDTIAGGVQWVDGGRSFLWSSERSGWRHIYRVARNGTTRQVTRGAFDVDRVAGIDEKNGWLYYIASPRSAVHRYLYRTKLDGSGEAERITPAAETGCHDYALSPKGDWAVHSWSAFGRPFRYELVRLSDHRVGRILENNVALNAALERLDRPSFEFLRLDIGEGLELDGWMIKPPDFDPAKRYPLLVYVYGEPAGVTVLDQWMGSTGLWHWMLAQQGYIVASIDNRGTPSLRGRAWRKVVYRKVGLLPAQEQAAAVRHLARRPYIDRSRIGSWGWSGGGSMTLNALFRYPEVYKAGISVAPVPDMRLYDTIYQERYMGLPQQNGEDYDRGSPITYANRLAGDLLLVHGSGDDNVHVQGTERLINALVESNKPFQMLIYPNRSHGISEGKNTTRHLFTSMTRFLSEKLPPGGR